MINDLMPGTPTEPFQVQESDEQKKRKEDAMAEVSSNLSIIQEVIDFFKEIEEDCRRTDLLDLSIIDKVPLEAQLLGLNELKVRAAKKNELFITKFKSYIEASKEVQE